MRIWILFGFVVLLAAIFSSRVMPIFVNSLDGVESAGDWRVACLPEEGFCKAWLELTKGERHNTNVKGEFGLLSIRAFIDSSGEKSVSIDINDDPVPHFKPVSAGRTGMFDGVRLKGVLVDGRHYSFGCVNSVCTANAPAHLMESMARSRYLVIEPLDRDMIVLDISDFARAFKILNDKVQSTSEPKIFGRRVAERIRGRIEGGPDRPDPE